MAWSKRLVVPANDSSCPSEQAIRLCCWNGLERVNDGMGSSRTCPDVVPFDINVLVLSLIVKFLIWFGVPVKTLPLQWHTKKKKKNCQSRATELLLLIEPLMALANVEARVSASIPPTPLINTRVVASNPQYKHCSHHLFWHRIDLGKYEQRRNTTMCCCCCVHTAPVQCRPTIQHCQGASSKSQDAPDRINSGCIRKQ